MTAIGQAGTISENTTFTGEPIQVTFDQPLTDPVIALTGTNFGGNKYVLRVIEVQTDPVTGDATGFTFTMDEWENHDGRHPAVEDINWIAVEAGVHTLPDGRTIEAGYAQADSDGEPVSLNGTYTDTPTVLTTVASDNDASNVDSDPFNVTSDGFDLIVEEAESQDGVHGLESVGWIAIEPGSGTDSGATSSAQVGSSWVNNADLGGTFDTAITVAETQTRNDPDTGTVIFRNQDDGDIDLRFEEDTSVDGDSGHIPETVGLVTFEMGVILCFDAKTQIETEGGLRAAHELRPGMRVVTKDHGLQPLTWCGARQISGEALAQAPHLQPIEFLPGSLSHDAPCVPLRVSPQHRMLLSGWKAEVYAGEPEILVPAKALLNDRSIRRVCPEEGITYVHLLCDRHEILRAAGTWSESLYPAHMAKGALDGDAQRELSRLFPGLWDQTDAYGALARPVLATRVSEIFR